MSGDIDLSELQLLPQWAKEPLHHNPYQNHEGETAPPRERRGGRDDRGRGGPGRRPADSRGRDSQRPPQNRGPRPEGGRNAGPRPSGPRRDQGGRPGRRPERDERQERPPENLPSLDVLFQPEPHGAESMVKQIKSSGRAYPVFELARMILKKPERHQVVLQIPANQTPEGPQSLFVCALDQSLWLSETDAVQHLLQKHLGKFYQAEKVAIDAPKGNFTCIGVCGMSGAVLGPPNHHDYPASVRRLYLERFSNMPFEAFKNRIQLVKDEAVLAKWKDQQSWKTEYVVKAESPAEAAAPAASEIPSAPVEKPENPATPEPPVSPETAGPTEANETAESAPAPEAEAASIEPAAETESPSEKKGEEPAPVKEGERLANLEAVRAHFIREYQAAQVQSVTSFVLPQTQTRQQSDPLIQKVIRRAWDSEIRFPSKTGPALIHSLSKNGLQFFKWNKGITHVSTVRPKRFDPAKSPVAEGVSKILAWVAGHPGKTRTDLVKALAPEAPAEPATPLAEPTPAVSAAGSVSPEAPAAEASQPNASSVLSDLHWLLHEGYIVEFANNQLDLLRQNDKPAKAPQNAPAPGAESPAPEPQADIPPTPPDSEKTVS